MQTRKLGKTGLDVSIVGFGSAEIGHDYSDEAAGELLNCILDAGVTLIDTAACYGEAEEKIGRAIGDRRDEYVLVTKCGHKVSGISAEEWTADAVTQSIARSLRRLRTDHVDVVLLHSCSAEKLTDDMLEVLCEAKQSGRSRFIGYSGDDEDAAVAVGMDMFDVLETSLSICDQQCLTKYLPRADQRGLGVIVKRPLANSCWRDISKFDAFYAKYARPYAERLEKMALTPEAVGFDGSFVELALRFAVHSPGVGAAIIGSTNLEHISSDIEIARQGPLPEEVYRRVRELWDEHDDGSWVGQV